jgi:hypothetical protein
MRSHCGTTLGFDGGYYMTCSKKFGKLPQLSCLGLIGMLTVVSCGGSDDNSKKDAGPDVGGIDAGVVTKANLTVTPATVSVGSVNIDTTSTAQTATVTNNGTAAAALTVTPSVAWIAASGCGASLAVNASCTLSITATPTTAGNISGSVSVAAAGGNTITIGVTGTATQPGNFTLSPATIPLNNVVVGTTVQATVVVTANAALTGMVVGVQGSDLKVDSATTCTGTLSAAASTCNVVVDFTATTVGTPTGDAVVVTQGGVSKNVPVTATVVTAAKLQATPTVASLAAAPGSVSQPLTINVGNNGGSSTGAIGVNLTGTNFKISSDNCSIVTLAPSATCSVIVTYQPSASVIAAETGTLTITDKGTGASSATVALTGIPNLPSTLTLTGSLSLGSVAPGLSGSEVLYTVTNTSSTASGTLTAKLNDNSYVTISSNTCTAKGTLGLNETCLVGLKLTPSSTATAQTVSATLTVTGAAVTNPVSISVTGTIVSGPALSASPTSISFGSIPVNQSSAVQTVTVTNTGAVATGTLAVNLSGTGVAQVTKTANTCTGTLAPAATCTIAVQYSPTDTTGVSGSLSVSDGSSTATVSIVGTGLAPSIFETDPVSVSFASVAVGYTAGEQTLKVGVASGTTTATGTITATIDGAAKDDFAVVSTTCTILQPGMTTSSGGCQYILKFTPSAVGTREATLTLVGAAGGLRTVPLSGKGLALVEIQPNGCAHVDGTVVSTASDITAGTATGLDFGKRTLGKTGDVCKYTAVVRGATATTAITTTATLALATTTPADFRNVAVTHFGSTGGDNGAQTVSETANPCSGQALSLVKSTGVPAADIAGSWADSTPATGTDTNHQTGDWECVFYVQFTPQTSKGSKTTSLTATGSAGGSASETLTGEAVGPLQFDADKTFADTIVGSSTTTTLTLTNNGVGVEGPLTIALGGTNATDFGIVADGCSGTSLAAGDHCTVKVALAPATTGAKAATITATSASSSETGTAALTGTATAAYTLALTPTSSSSAPITFGSVAQAAASDYKTFTITNPAGGGLTDVLSYGIGSCTADSDSNFKLFTLTDSTTGYPTGSCGDRNSKQLAGGSACTVQVRFNPTNTADPSLSTARTDALWVCVGGVHTLTGSLSGIATSQLTVSGSALTTASDGTTVADFGKVAKAGTKSVSYTLTNNGLSIATLTIPSPLADSTGTDGAFTIATDSGCSATLAAGTSCTVKYTVTAAADATDVVTAISTITAGDHVSTSVSLKATPVDPADIILYGVTGNVDAAGDYIEFGKLPINSTATNGSGIVTLWFKNQGGIAGTGLALTLTNRDATDTSAFALVSENQGTCYTLTGGELAAGATCSVRVRFKPTTTGSKTAQLTLTATDSASVYLRGEADANPALGLSVAVVGGTDTVYAFPATAIADSSTVYLQLQNAGSVDYVQTFLAVGGQASNFVVTGEKTGTGTACGYDADKNVTVPASGICQVKVTFTPATPWAETTRYRWSALQTNSNRVFGLIGQAKQPAKLALSATASGTTTVDADLLTVNFGQVLSDTSSSVVFTITNVGETATLVAPVLTLTANAQAIAQIASSTCTAALDVNGTCTVTVATKNTLTKGAYGYGAATDPLASATAEEGSATSSSAYKLSLAVVAAASLKINPSAEQAEGSLAVGATSTSTTLTIINGNAGETSSNRQDLSGLSISLSNSTDFVVDYDSCATLIAATTDGTFKLTGGNSCTIKIAFAPTTVGSLSSTVTVSSGSNSSSVKFTGTGIGSLAFTATSSASSPIDASTNVTLTLKNSSASVTGVLRTTLGGTNSSAFAVTADNCYGTTVDGNDTCTVTVKFIGTLSTTAQTATVTVTDGSATASATAYLSAKSS